MAVAPTNSTNPSSPTFVGPPAPTSSGNPASPNFIGPPAPTSSGNPASPSFVGPPAPTTPVTPPTPTDSTAASTPPSSTPTSSTAQSSNGDGILPNGYTPDGLYRIYNIDEYIYFGDGGDDNAIVKITDLNGKLLYTATPFTPPAASSGQGTTPPASSSTPPASGSDQGTTPPGPSTSGTEPGPTPSPAPGPTSAAQPGDPNFVGPLQPSPAPGTPPPDLGTPNMSTVADNAAVGTATALLAAGGAGATAVAAGERVAIDAAVAGAGKAAVDPAISQALAGYGENASTGLNVVNAALSAAQITHQIGLIQQDYVTGNKNLGADVRTLTVQVGQFLGKTYGADVLGNATIVTGAATLQPEVVAAGLIEKELGKQAAGAAGAAAGWIVGSGLQYVIDQSMTIRPPPLVGPPKPSPVPSPQPNHALLQSTGRLTTQPMFTTAPTADVSYIDTQGALHPSTFATKPVDPNATLPVKEAVFIVPETTYPITAQTLGADVANAYISFIRNGNVGVLGTNEAMKLAGDLIIGPAALGNDPKSLSDLSATIGKILGGDATNASYIGQIVQADLAAPVPAGILDRLNNYIDNSVMGAPSAGGSVMRYLNDVSRGMTSIAAFTDVTGSVPK